MGRKNCGKWPQKMVHRPQAENENSLRASLARASVKGTETEKEKEKETETETKTETEKEKETEKETKGIKTVIVIVSETVRTRSARKIASRTVSVIENETEGRIMTERVGALDIIDTRTTTAMDDIPHEIMRGEIGIRIRMSIKTRIGKAIGRQNMGIIEIQKKMTGSGIETGEETAKRDTVLEIGLMIPLRRNVTRERGVPHTLRKGLGRNVMCMMIAYKMIELKRLVVILYLLLHAKPFLPASPI